MLRWLYIKNYSDYNLQKSARYVNRTGKNQLGQMSPFFFLTRPPTSIPNVLFIVMFLLLYKG